MSATLKKTWPAKTAIAGAASSLARPIIKNQYFDDPVELNNAKFVQTVLPWIALENFRLGVATDTDWMMLQYWLYYAEGIITLHDFEVAEERIELGTRVAQSLGALFAGGRRYNESAFTVMTLTHDECDLIRDGLLIGSEIAAITDELGLIAVGRHVQRVLTVAPEK